MATIHPTAVVHPDAKIAEGVEIGPYSIVGPDVHLKEGVVLRSHVVVEGHTTIGQGTVVFQFASIGAKPQDLKYRGEKTFVFIGKNCEIRECVTVNSSCGEGTAVRIGDNCLLMAYVHVAHNCTLGNNVILSNNVSLAGHVDVGNYAIVGGFTPVHQFTRIGAHAMCGGMSRLDGDLGPFLIGGGSDFKVGGINLVGLRRREFDLERTVKLGKLFKWIYRTDLSLEAAIQNITKEFSLEDEDVRLWVEFFSAQTKRGYAGYKRAAQLEPAPC
ncbi:acyl-ACP--UDP-N-acetylglucosamine O-acyltransferase [bacterium]|nr:acyl-ACP--UDP-N-acetylglucosamine O-acyltransferase [Chlamydiota bacterium]NDD99680.1 acyl-ACP--UDP-N-acetylglucosamine O-acyltransferase [bacterium]